MSPLHADSSHGVCSMFSLGISLFVLLVRGPDPPLLTGTPFQRDVVAVSVLVVLVIAQRNVDSKEVDVESQQRVPYREVSP